MTPWGVDGAFTASMVAAARAFAAAEDLLVVMVALFLRDELAANAAGPEAGAGEPAVEDRLRELVTLNTRGVWARLRAAATVSGERADGLGGLGGGGGDGGMHNRMGGLGGMLPAGIAPPPPPESPSGGVDEATGAATVTALVRAAMAEERLCRMPPGWQPWF